MRIFSGNCCFCDIGRPTDTVDMDGNELFTGDIVQLWRGHFIGTANEEWYPSTGLTAIVANQYQTYGNNNGGFDHILIDENAKPFTMGIMDIGVHGEHWHVKLIKSHTDIVPGEKFKDFKFNYQE